MDTPKNPRPQTPLYHEQSRAVPPTPSGYDRTRWEEIYDGYEVHLLSNDGSAVGPFLVVNAASRAVKWLPYGKRSFAAPRSSIPLLAVNQPRAPRPARPEIDKTKVQTAHSRLNKSFLKPRPPPAGTQMELPQWQKTKAFYNHDDPYTF